MIAASARRGPPAGPRGSLGGSSRQQLVNVRERLQTKQKDIDQFNQLRRRKRWARQDSFRTDLCRRISRFLMFPTGVVIFTGTIITLCSCLGPIGRGTFFWESPHRTKFRITGGVVLLIGTVVMAINYTLYKRVRTGFRRKVSLPLVEHECDLCRGMERKEEKRPSRKKNTNNHNKGMYSAGSQSPLINPENWSNSRTYKSRSSSGTSSAPDSPFVSRSGHWIGPKITQVKTRPESGSKSGVVDRVKFVSEFRVFNSFESGSEHGSDPLATDFGDFRSENGAHSMFSYPESSFSVDKNEIDHSKNNLYKFGLDSNSDLSKGLESMIDDTNFENSTTRDGFISTEFAPFDTRSNNESSQSKRYGSEIRSGLSEAIDVNITETLYEVQTRTGLQLDPGFPLGQKSVDTAVIEKCESWRSQNFNGSQHFNGMKSSREFGLATKARDNIKSESSSDIRRSPDAIVSATDASKYRTQFGAVNGPGPRLNLDALHVPVHISRSKSRTEIGANSSIMENGLNLYSSGYTAEEMSLNPWIGANPDVTFKGELQRNRYPIRHTSLTSERSENPSENSPRPSDGSSLPSSPRPLGSSHPSSPRPQGGPSRRRKVSVPNSLSGISSSELSDVIGEDYDDTHDDVITVNDCTMALPVMTQDERQVIRDVILTLSNFERKIFTNELKSRISVNNCYSTQIGT